MCICEVCMTESTTDSGTGFEGENHPDRSGSSSNELTDDDWGKTAEDILGESSFDEELGKQMSRDAIRTSRGEMSEEEFYEMYHDRVIEEFGVDKRPVKSGGTND